MTEPTMEITLKLGEEAMDELRCIYGMQINILEQLVNIQELIKKGVVSTDTLVKVPSEEPKMITPAKTKEPEPVETPAPAEPEETKNISFEDLQALAQKLLAPELKLKQQVKDIVYQYGSRVSTIPEDKYAEAYTKLKELEVKT